MEDNKEFDKKITPEVLVRRAWKPKQFFSNKLINKTCVGKKNGR